MHFGEHITIDGYGGKEDLLNNRDLILNTLNELVQKLDMHKLAEPVIYEAPGNDIKDPGGWSAFVVIAESHISIHTFPKRGFVSADVYTCKNGLDQELVKNTFRNSFQLSNVDTNFIKRGERYPEFNIY